MPRQLTGAAATILGSDVTERGLALLVALEELVLSEIVTSRPSTGPSKHVIIDTIACATGGRSGCRRRLSCKSRRT